MYEIMYLVTRTSDYTPCNLIVLKRHGLERTIDYTKTGKAAIADCGLDSCNS